ncbi:MAG TPA: S8 family serine peptidase [Blastocatellia bacterium]|nr:S8 family serine peptidase [Blastocatellia bacterium]
MRMRIIFGIIAAAACLSISAVNASRESESRDLARKPSLAKHAASIRPGSYRSPGALRKVVVHDDEALAEAKASGAAEIADYGSFRLLMMDEAALQQSEQRFQEASNRSADLAADSPAFTVRDDLNVLLLRSGAIDTTAGDAPGSLIAMGSAASTDTVKPIDATLRLIQFVGPVKNAWINELVASGLELIAYVPNNAYLVRGDSRSRDRLMARNQTATARSEGFVQWEGPFLDSYKVHPALVRSMTERSGEITVAVQLALGKRVTNARENTEVQAVKHLASAVMVDAYGVLGFTNLRIRIDSSRVADLAALPSVVNIEPWNAPQLFDERASQIIAGELTSDGTAPRGPGYLAWLAAHGFSSAFNFGIDVADSGLDRGVITADKLHPDFLDSNKQSRVVYARDYTSELDPSDVGGHGTINLSIAGGSNLSLTARDTGGFGYGIGVAPFARLGSSKIFQANGRFDLIDPFTKLISDAYRDGARVVSNSWGDISNSYSLDSQEYDLRVRDASPGEAGNQEIPICFAAGNAGPNGAVGSPSTAKNVISVAAGENARKDGTDGCNVRDSEADNALDMATFSSGGPLVDGRIKPDITAPGTHIEGAASQNADFDGSGVCGQAFDKPYFPTGQTLYTWSSGTSHSTPQVAGAAALVRQYLLNRGETPNAAFIKALMLNTTTYMTGQQASGNLPHPRQGWGLLNLNRAFDNTPRIFVNQSTTFTDSGQSFVITGEVKDTSQPFRVTLAWSDAPGFSGAAPWVNDLDLEVAINGQLFRGNNFLGQVSQPGGEPDIRNNVEGVWLPAGTAGTFVIRVRATNIAGDGVPGNTDLTDQDFALVVYNGEKKDAPVAGISNLTLTGGADAFADPGDACSMALRIEDLSPIALNGAHGVLTTTTTGVTITGNSSDFPNIASGQSGDGLTPFTFTVDRSVACGSLINFVLDVTSQGLLSRVPFSVRVGRSQATDFFLDDIESGELKWTHGSGIKKKKNRVDTWVISTKRVHAGASSWFTKDPGDKVTDAHLDTVPIQLPADARTLQLVFFHTFEFERGTFDGGVIEISTGGDFEDLGSKITKGGYNGTVFEFTTNPLIGQPAWVEGRLGAFQQVVVDLSSYAGKTVTIRFRIGTDADGKGLGWYIDDVRLRGDRVSCTPVALDQ